MTPGDTRREVGRVHEKRSSREAHTHTARLGLFKASEKNKPREGWTCAFAEVCLGSGTTPQPIAFVRVFPPSLPPGPAPLGRPTPRRVGRGLDSRARPEPPPLPRRHPSSAQSFAEGLGAGLRTSATVTARPPAGGAPAPRQPCAPPRRQTRQRRPCPRPGRSATGRGHRPAPPEPEPPGGGVGLRPLAFPAAGSVPEDAACHPRSATSPSQNPLPAGFPGSWCSSCSGAPGGGGDPQLPAAEHPPSAMKLRFTPVLASSLAKRSVMQFFSRRNWSNLCLMAADMAGTVVSPPRAAPSAGGCRTG